MAATVDPIDDDGNATERPSAFFESTTKSYLEQID